MAKRVKPDFYVKRKSKLMKKFEKKLGYTTHLFINLFDKQNISSIYEEIKKEFELILAELQYIGGNKNPFTAFLIGSAEMFSIIRVFEKKGISFEEIGQFIFEYDEILNKRREEMLRQLGQKHSEQIFTEDYLNFMRGFAEDSQNRIYKGDWVFEFIEGKGKDFTYGYNFSQCGIYELSKKLGLQKYAKYICLADFTEATASGFGLTRTQTISNGDPICDHRYTKGETTLRAWPPDRLPEFK